MSCGHSLKISVSQLMISYFIFSLHMLIPWLINVFINYITSTLGIVGSGNSIGRLLINVMGLSELTVAGNISSVLFLFLLSLSPSGRQKHSSSCCTCAQTFSGPTMFTCALGLCSK